MRPLILVAALALPLVAQAGFRVSSFKTETRRGANTWNAAAALDSDPESAWMVEPEADNVGSWFEVDVPKCEVDKIGLMIGWERDDETFTDYHRVRTLKVELFSESADDPRRPVLEHSITFQDQRGWQVVDIPNTVLGDELNGGRIRLTVMETYEGRDYPNLAVSEVLVHLVEREAPIEMRTPPDSAHEDHFPGDMTDGNTRTYWSAGPSGTGNGFEVTANGHGVSSVGIEAGPRTHSRPKTMTIRANDVSQTIEVPEDARGMQWYPVAPLTGYMGSGFGRVSVEVTDTWPGSSVDELAISEVQLRATVYDGL